MARNLPTLERWRGRPALAEWLSGVLNCKEGAILLETVQYHFRAVPDKEASLEKHGLRNAAREGVQAVLELLDVMSIAHEKKERLPDEGWATQPLRREDDKEPKVKPKPTKKK